MSTQYQTTQKDTAVSSGYGGGGSRRFKCAEGAYISSLKGRSDNIVRQVCAYCSDGNLAGCMGEGRRGTLYNYEYPEGLYEISGRSGEFLDKINSSGGDGGSPFTIGCADGKRAVGIFGLDGWDVTSIGLTCDYDANNYCVNNLDTDFCKNLNGGKGPNVNILNKACGLKMTDTCRNRKNELEGQLMAKFCIDNQNDPLCSCYATPPDYIPQEMRAKVRCWNKKCAESGYIPENMRGDCDKITICKQNISAMGDSNLIKENVYFQDCSDKSTTNNITNKAAEPIPNVKTDPNIKNDSINPTPDKLPPIPYEKINNTKVINNENASGGSSNNDTTTGEYIAYGIGGLVGLILLIFVGMALFRSNGNNKTTSTRPNRPIPIFQQQMNPQMNPQMRPMPMQSMPMNQSQMQSMPMNQSQMQSMPMNQSQMQSMPMNQSQMQSMPMNQSQMQSMPMNPRMQMNPRPWNR